jgi:hypothetical protein
MVRPAIVSDIFRVAVSLHLFEQCHEIRGQALRFRAARAKGAPRTKDILDGLVGVYLSSSRHQNFSCGSRLPGHPTIPVDLKSFQYNHPWRFEAQVSA